MSKWGPRAWRLRWFADRVYAVKNRERGDRVWEANGLQGLTMAMDRYTNRLRRVVLQRDYGTDLTQAEVLEITNDLLDLENHLVMAFDCMEKGYWYVGDNVELTLETLGNRADRIKAILLAEYGGAE